MFYRQKEQIQLSLRRKLPLESHSRQILSCCLHFLLFVVRGKFRAELQWKDLVENFVD